MESKETGTGVVLAEEGEGMFERLRGTAVQPYSSTRVLDILGFVVEFDVKASVIDVDDLLEVESSFEYVCEPRIDYLYGVLFA
jgi:hypothetical protein